MKNVEVGGRSESEFLGDGRAAIRPPRVRPGVRGSARAFARASEGGGGRGGSGDVDGKKGVEVSLRGGEIGRAHV